MHKTPPTFHTHITDTASLKNQHPAVCFKRNHRNSCFESYYTGDTCYSDTNIKCSRSRICFVKNIDYTNYFVLTTHVLCVDYKCTTTSLGGTESNATK